MTEISHSLAETIEAAEDEYFGAFGFMEAFRNPEESRPPQIQKRP